MNLSNVDLNIDNYSLEDILKLFHLDYNFKKDDLMKCKKIVYKTHPDKSKLDPKYFLFFSKAYNVIFKIFEFKNKQQIKTYQEDFFSEEKKKLLKNYLEENKLSDQVEFNKWFNEQFSKENIEQSKGYGDWLKSNEGILTTDNLSKEEMNSFLYEQKKKQTAIISMDNISDFSKISSNNNFFDFNEYNNHSFSGSSKGLAFQDLKEAYTETLIPITEDELLKKKIYRDINDIRDSRNIDELSFKPMNNKESEAYFYSLEKNKEEESTRNAFYYARDLEKNNDNNNKFWSSIQKLKM